MGLLHRIFGEKEKEQYREYNKRIVCGKLSVYSPMEGVVIPLKEVEDPVFSGGIMGVGAGIQPEADLVYAPVDGVVAAVFPTGHAIGIQTDDGMEVLIHIGINTVELEGKGFKSFVKEGDRIKAGDLLIEFKRKWIQEQGYPVTVVVLVSNGTALGKMTDPIPGSVKPLDFLYSFQDNV